MDDSSTIWLLSLAVVLLLFVSAFFSGSETALMALNRYRLKNMADSGYRPAQIAERLLARPDRLIGLILVGNNIVNILAAQLVALICLNITNNWIIAAVNGIFVFAVLIIAEVTPKTLAANKPEKIAFPAALVYWVLEKPFAPFVVLVNFFSNGLLKLLRAAPDANSNGDALNADELRAAVVQARGLIHPRYQQLLINVLDLQSATVEDIMVPRAEIQGIDLDDPWDKILESIESSQHTRLVVYRDDIDRAIGIIHLRKILPALRSGNFDKATIKDIARDAYFVPENTPLSQQLSQFQLNKRRIALVVDEYGDIKGLITLEDILEEIVGEFTSDPAALHTDVIEQHDGSFLVRGNISIRSLNRLLKSNLPTNGPKTLNGLILEALEEIPETGMSVKVKQHPIEIIQTEGMRVISAKIARPK